MINFEDGFYSVVDALDKLAALGSPEQVASYLKQQHCLGHHSSKSCPVQRYVTKSTGVVGTSVDTHTTVVGFYTARSATMSNPMVVSEFIRMFDGGHFPELEMAG